MEPIQINDDKLKEFLEKIKNDKKAHPNMMSINDLFDHSFMTAFKLNDDQYDFICENATDEELDLLCGPGNNDDSYTFSQKKEIVQIIKKYKQLHASNSTDLDF